MASPNSHIYRLTPQEAIDALIRVQTLRLQSVKENRHRVSADLARITDALLGLLLPATELPLNLHDNPHADWEDELVDYAFTVLQASVNPTQYPDSAEKALKIRSSSSHLECVLSYLEEFPRAARKPEQATAKPEEVASPHQADASSVGEAPELAER